MTLPNQNCERDQYDMAQICLNGHIINTHAETEPEYSKNHCSECGAETITSCRRCGAKILGQLHPSPKYLRLPMFGAPKFCWNCGALYPWTETRLNAAHALASKIKGISKEERRFLYQSIDDLVANTAQTNVAIVRIKQIMSKIGPEMRDTFKEVLIEVLSEAAKKAIWEQ